MTSPTDAMRAPALRPRALRPGSRVALVAPSGPVPPERVEAAQERCRSEGLEPVLLSSAGARHRYMAGTDDQRLADLQAAFRDPSVDAIWALRGGYGAVRLLDRLDLGRQRADPIPYIGFSDNTAIHARHVALGVISFHGPHPGAAFPEETAASFRRVLFEPTAAGPLPVRSGDPLPRTLVPGSVTAPLVGGNLALVAALCGTPHGLNARGHILFLEDVGEPAYRVDRMLWQLRASGTLEGVAGLAFGRFTESPDEDRHPVGEVLAELAEALRIPAVADLPFGHVDHNCTLPVGGMARLEADGGVLTLTEPAVRAG